MRLKAVIEGNQIRLIDGDYYFPTATAVEIEVPADKVVPIRDEHPLSQRIRELMGRTEGEEFDWKEEWHQHLETKYES